ncbi:MAG: hypothetical protein KBG30_09130 [Bacteroidales bacterium]|jgi:hypothetical protein|nr:hypothetical protein [Bacteroidales bacterium]
MKQFLNIALRNQFNLFYRFGYTILPKSGLVEFDGIINDEIKEKIITQFKTVAPFEYDEEYLILHLDKAISNESEFVQFEINDIVAVYPLSQQAKISIEGRIDQRIKLEKPIFETILPTIETEIEHNEIKNAISALWSICKNEGLFEKYIADIGLENIFNGLEYRKLGTKANKIQNGNYWEYLIAYDRFDYFPNSTLGYFYDAGQVFAFNKGLPSFEGSGTHKFLENLNSNYPTIKFLDIIKYFETEEQLKGYVSQTTKGDIKQYIVAPLYLMLRDEIRKSDDISQTKLFKNLDYLKGFGDSFYYSVVLLGAFFGFRKFYDPYYEVLNLRFYKNFKAQKKQVEKEVQQENLGIVSNTDEVVKPFIEEQKQTETKNEDEVCEPSINVVKDLDEKTEIQAEESIAEPTVVELSNSSNTQQNDNKEGTSEIVIQYQKIIEAALDKQAEIKLSEIVVMIKEMTGKKVQNSNVESVAKEMKGIEIFKIGQAKAIRRTTGLLFN